MNKQQKTPAQREQPMKKSTAVQAPLPKRRLPQDSSTLAYL